MPTFAANARTAVLSLLTRDEKPSRLLERAGAFTWADKLDRARVGSDIVSVPLPIGPGQLRGHRIKMYGFEGQDMAVTAILENGWRGFERPTPEVLVRLVRSHPGMVYDVGANSGIYALLAVESRPGTKVVAFEPFPPALDALRANLALNRYGSRIEVVPAAVAESEGNLDLFVPVDSGFLETSASLNGDFKPEIAERLSVPTVTIDGDWNRRGRPRVAIMKIDTESTEHQVLRGSEELVRNERPVIVFEVLPQADVEDLNRFARDHDLVAIRMTGSAATVGDEVEHDPRGWNQLFVPEERLQQMVPILGEAGLEVAFSDSWSSARRR